MRKIGAIVLGTLWILLLAIYTAPLWLRRKGSLDFFTIWVEPPGRTWMAVVLAVILLLLPPLVLGFATWRWMRG